MTLRRVLLGNWPVKLGAVGLAVVLYAGVALSENTRTWDGPIPIEVLRSPPGGALLEQPGPVTQIRYRAPLETTGQVTGATFRASVDLARVEPHAGGEPVSVAVDVTSVDPRIRIVDFLPRSVNVRVDDVVTRGLPVTIQTGPLPEGIEVGPLGVEPSRVFLRGASSRIANVRSVVGRLSVDASGLNIDQDVVVEAYDEADAAVPGIEIDPASVRVRADVARRLGYVTLPVIPELVGELRRGLRVASVRVTPPTVTVGGEDTAVRALTIVPTEPIDLTGLEGSREVDVGLTLPAEVSVEGEPRVMVSIDVAAEEGTRAIQAGAALTGTRADRTYRLEDPSVSVVLGGSVDALEAVDASALVVGVPVDELELGTHEVAPSIALPPGVEVQRVTPERVRVTVDGVDGSDGGEAA